MKKLIKAVIAVFIVFILMFTEYRFIMHNIIPYRGEGGTVYIEIFGHTDEYYAERIG